MIFTSVTFIIFIAIIFAIYYAIPKKYQWILLLVGSYAFYMWQIPWYACFLLYSTSITWIFSRLIGNNNENLVKYRSTEEYRSLEKENKLLFKNKTQLKNRNLLVLCLACNIGLLAVLKYTNFAIITLNSLGSNLQLIDRLILPIGISFYIFQSTGYIIDVYRESISPQHNFFKYALFVSFFPQISMGPIGRYDRLAPQLYAQHSFDYDQFTFGLMRMLLGFFKKLAIADILGVYVNAVYADTSSVRGITITIATILYALQLYADFSGYTDIALGIGNCLGIKLDENFKQPYFSRSIPEYWRRWHISLGAWFKDYLFLPILRSSWCMKVGKFLSRKGYKRLSQLVTTIIGLSITWFLTGLWHGASWTFILWGLWFGIFIILSTISSKFYPPNKGILLILNKNKYWHLIQILRTDFVVCLSYILFRSTDLENLMNILFVLFRRFSISNSSQLMTNVLPRTNWALLFLCLLIVFIIEIIDMQGGFLSFLVKTKKITRWFIIYFFIFLIYLCTDISLSTANFLYFDF
ncbi:MAG: hypothetical protein LBT59_01800 [Clostridiales bacterium]|nr:hypothetical protein [Clostridiales bacterium]